MTPEKMLNNLIKKSLQPILKAEGFKKKGLQWNCSRGAFIDVLTVQEAKHSSPEEVVFTINIGIFIPEFFNIIWDKSFTGFATEADCVARHRFGELIQGNLEGDALDQWWSISDLNTAEAVSEELVSSMNRELFPFFNSLDTFEALLEHVKKDKGWQSKSPLGQIQNALLSWKSGYEEESLELLSNIRGKAWQPRVQAAIKAIKANRRDQAKS